MRLSSVLSFATASWLPALAATDEHRSSEAVVAVVAPSASIGSYCVVDNRGKIVNELRDPTPRPDFARASLFPTLLTSTSAPTRSTSAQVRQRRLAPP